MEQPAPLLQPGMQNAVAGLAITQLVIGVLCLIVGILALALSSIFIYMTGAIEIWTEIFFIVAGVLGILASRQQSHGMMVAHMILSIISSVTAFILFVDGCVWSWVSIPHIVLAILAFVEFVVSIISASFCCRAVCCRTNARQGVVYGGPGVVVAQPGGVTVYHQQQPGNVQYVTQQPQQPYPGQYPQGQYPQGQQAQAQPAPVMYTQYAVPNAPPAGQPQDYPTKPPPY